jgi:hypothetical protein
MCLVDRWWHYPRPQVRIGKPQPYCVMYAACWAVSHHMVLYGMIWYGMAWYGQHLLGQYCVVWDGMAVWLATVGTATGCCQGHQSVAKGNLAAVVGWLVFMITPADHQSAAQTGHVAPGSLVHALAPPALQRPRIHALLVVVAWS